MQAVLFALLFCFCCESDLSFLPQSPLTGWEGGFFLRWRSEKVILKLVPPLVFWHCTKRFPMFPGIFMPCQIKYTNSTSLLSSAALLMKKEKPSAALLSLGLQCLPSGGAEMIFQPPLPQLTPAPVICSSCKDAPWVLWLSAGVISRSYRKSHWSTL